ncbi:putative gluconokinase [Psilocybe cubensis]|uniref:Gluconokinase n=1 Tax=Psilocybe cubensis TaxID=181762 RepID=A0ACB8HAJ2_PSICU|nr:putative gluconokinase [Psilocybe cubensis]KAH9484861.1 putative gluconokinase [Psilocybe cubensis]
MVHMELESDAGRQMEVDAEAGREVESCALDDAVGSAGQGQGEVDVDVDVDEAGKEREEEEEKVLIIVMLWLWWDMGVSGTGKSTLSHALAHTLSFAHIEGDDLHPRANVEKMSAGVPLGDGDREPWLARVRAEGVRVLVEGEKGKGCRGVVVSCSALKAYYRDILRGKRPLSSPSSLSAPTPTPTHAEIQTYFVHISGSPALLLERMEKRPGHFMKAPMLASQLRTLEDPAGEPGVVVVDLERGTGEQVREALRGLRGVVPGEGKEGRGRGFVRYLEEVERGLDVKDV